MKYSRVICSLLILALTVFFVSCRTIRRSTVSYSDGFGIPDVSPQTKPSNNNTIEPFPFPDDPTRKVTSTAAKPKASKPKTSIAKTPKPKASIAKAPKPETPKSSVPVTKTPKPKAQPPKSTRYSGFSTRPPKMLKTQTEKSLGVRTTHTIVDGETLGDLAQHYKVTVAAIKKLNNLSFDLVNVGKKILIPLPAKQ